MTTTASHSSPASATERSTRPGRRTLVLLAGAFLLFFAALMALGADNRPDADVADLVASYDQSEVVVQITSYAAMVACAVLVFLGAGVRSALRHGNRNWLADVAGLGFLAVALTIASWAVTALAMWHAVDIGDATLIRAVNLLDTTNFLPLMMGMVCTMLGAGLAGLKSGALPRWLAVVSIVLGCFAPLGPLAFVPTLLLPLWLIAVAVTVRLEA